MTLRLVVATLLLSRSMGDQQRINYGVISLAFDPNLNINALVFHKHDSNNLLQNLYLNVYEK
jgi:hypothetical protein